MYTRGQLECTWFVGSIGCVRGCQVFPSRIIRQYRVVVCSDEVLTNGVWRLLRVVRKAPFVVGRREV